MYPDSLCLNLMCTCILVTLMLILLKRLVRCVYVFFAMLNNIHSSTNSSANALPSTVMCEVMDVPSLAIVLETVLDSNKEIN